MTIKEKAKEIVDTIFYSFFSLIAQVYKIMSITALFLKLNYINEFLNLNKIKEFFDNAVSFVKQYKSILLYILLTFGAISAIRKISSHKKHTFSLLRSILKLFELVAIASLLLIANLTGVPTLALLIAYFTLDLITYPLRYAHSLHKKQLVQEYNKIIDDDAKIEKLKEYLNKGHSAYALHKLFSDKQLITTAINQSNRFDKDKKTSLVNQLPKEDDKPNARETYIQKKDAGLFKKIRKFTTSAIIFALEVAVLFTTGNPAIACFIAAFVVSMASKIWDCIVSNPLTSAWKAFEKLFKLAYDGWNSKKIEVKPPTPTPKESHDLKGSHDLTAGDYHHKDDQLDEDFTDEKALNCCMPDRWYTRWFKHLYPR